MGNVAQIKGSNIHVMSGIKWYLYLKIKFKLIQWNSSGNEVYYNTHERYKILQRAKKSHCSFRTPLLFDLAVESRPAVSNMRANLHQEKASNLVSKAILGSFRPGTWGERKPRVSYSLTLQH